jgi:hypothetical protein
VTGATVFRHCERSEATQSSVPQAKRPNMVLAGAKSHGADNGTEDWMPSSLRSSQ